MSSAARWTACWLFVTLSLFYVLCTGGHVYSPDGVVVGRVTESIFERGRLSADPKGIPPGFLVRGRGGESYAKYAPALSFVALPFYGVGSVMERLAPSYSVDVFDGPKVLWYSSEDRRDTWRFFGLGLTNAFVVAACCVLVFLLLVELGYSLSTAVGVALLAGVATPLWDYAKTFFAEPLGALGLLLFALFAERGEKGRAGVNLLVAGLGLGLSAAAKYAHGLLFPVAGLLLLYLLWRRRTTWGGRLRGLLAFGLGVGLVLLPMGLFNLARFGSVLTTGYESELDRWSTPWWVGLRGLLVSPGRGLLTYFPLLLLGVACAPAFARRSAHWTVFSLAVPIVLLGSYCRWYAWDGGWCWGPRFLLPAIPLLCLLSAPFVERPPLSRLWRWSGYAVILCSIGIAFSGTLVAYTDFHETLRARHGGVSYLDVARWDWTAYPPLAYWSFEPKLYYLFPRALGHASGWWLAALGGFLLGPLALAAYLLLRSVSSREGGPRTARVAVAVLAAGCICAVVAARVSYGRSPRVTLQFDFEDRAYPAGWTTSGSAFSDGPRPGPETGQARIVGPYGGGLVNSCLEGDEDRVGRLRSPEFTIRGRTATFLIGGGDDPRTVAARLLVDGREVLRTSGSGGERLVRRGWDLGPYLGRKARLELLDEARGAGGHLLFDDFRVYDARR